MSFNTPILFLVFNRPDTTQRVFEMIRAIQPKYLYVAADGPRLDKEGEMEKCETVRKIVSDIDWNCNLFTLFRNENKGCGKAVSEAITWFFEHVEEGIILEDDCLPSISFFYYCDKMLKKYKGHERIMHIGGTNFQKGVRRGCADIYFSKIPHVWGWATWKRAWDHYNFNMKTLSNDEIRSVVLLNTSRKDLQEYWVDVFFKMVNNPIDTWDYQWQYSIWKNNGLSIIPNKNLIKNIGFGSDATHTFDENSFSSNVVTHEFYIKTYPFFTTVNNSADLFTYKHSMGVKFNMNFLEKLYVKNKIKKLKNLLLGYGK